MKHLKFRNEWLLMAAMACTISPLVRAADEVEGKPSEAVGKLATAEEMKMADQRFLQEAYSGGMLHVMASKYALEQVKSPALRKLAEMLVEHHDKAGMKLKDVAKKEGITLPTELLPPHRAMLDAAMKIKGEQFATTYLINMWTLHVHDILQFSNAAAKSKSEAIKEFASAGVPMLREHLGEIKPLAVAEVELKDAL